MTYRLAFCFAICLLVLAPPESARATTSFDDVYQAVDAIQMHTSTFSVTGILSGETTSRTNNYIAGDAGARATCERFAVLAMSKPGKFQYVVGNTQTNPVSCKLALRTP